jgi:hypothetical protein
MYVNIALLVYQVHKMEKQANVKQAPSERLMGVSAVGLGLRQLLRESERGRLAQIGERVGVRRLGEQPEPQ